MLKVFLKDTFIYAIGVFAIRLINFILMPFLTRKLLPAEYGIITLILTLGPIVSYLFTLQITQAIPKFCASHCDEINKKNYISSSFWYVIFVYILIFLMSNIIRYPIERILGFKNQLALYNLSIINICLFGIFTFLETQLRWDKKVIEYTIVSVVIMSLSLILIIGFIYLNMGLVGYFIGSAIAQLIGCAMAFYYSKNNYQFIFSKKLLLQMLNFTYPLTIAAVGGYVYANINQWLIRFFCDLSAVGIYGVTSRFSSVVPVIMGCVSLSITPIIYAEYRNNEMKHFISFLFRVCFLFSLWCAAIFAMFHQEILSIAVGKAFFPAGKYIPLVLISYAFTSFYIFTPGQWIFNKTKEMAAINLISGALNVVLSLILVKLFFITGAVVALFISSILQLGLNIYFNNKYYVIDFKIVRLLVTLLLFLAFYSLKTNLFLLFGFMLVSFLLLISKDDINSYFLHGFANRLKQDPREA